MRQYRDRKFINFDELCQLLYAEHRRQIVKEAISEHEYHKGSSVHVVKEAVQVATLALKIAEMYDQ